MNSMFNYLSTYAVFSAKETNNMIIGACIIVCSLLFLFASSILKDQGIISYITSRKYRNTFFVTQIPKKYFGHIRYNSDTDNYIIRVEQERKNCNHSYCYENTSILTFSLIPLNEYKGNFENCYVVKSSKIRVRRYYKTKSYEAETLIIKGVYDPNVEGKVNEKLLVERYSKY